MAWARKSSPASKAEPQPTLIGLDLNATRARAVHGPAHVLPRSLPLAGTEEDLPMILSLKGRQAEVGRAGVGLCRLLPHLTCADFLAHLGESREWVAGRHRLDAAKALALVFGQLAPACAGAQGVVLAIPAYLDAGPGNAAAAFGGDGTPPAAWYRAGAAGHGTRRLSCATLVRRGPGCGCR